MVNLVTEVRRAKTLKEELYYDKPRYGLIEIMREERPILVKREGLGLNPIASEILPAERLCNVTGYVRGDYETLSSLLSNIYGYSKYSAFLKLEKLQIIRREGVPRTSKSKTTNRIEWRGCGEWADRFLFFVTKDSTPKGFMNYTLYVHKQYAADIKEIFKKSVANVKQQSLPLAEKENTKKVKTIKPSRPLWSKLSECTKYPRIFKGTYWGNFTYGTELVTDGDRMNTNMVIENRNRFVINFKIIKRISIPSIPPVPTTMDVFDHLEAYMSKDGSIVLCTHPYYSSNNKEALKEELFRIGFDPIPQMYHAGALSYQRIIWDLKAFKTYCKYGSTIVIHSKW